MSRIIITTERSYAFSIAAAYDGIYVKGKHVSSRDLHVDMDDIMAQHNESALHTKIGGEESVILWQKSEALVNFGKVSKLTVQDLPYLSTIHYRVSKKWQTHIQKYVEADPTVDKITLVLTPTMRASFFTNLLPELFPKFEYTIVTLTEINDTGIRKAFENERQNTTVQTRSYFDSDLCRKRITDLVRINISAAMLEQTKRYIPADQYILTSLFMIKKRESLKGKKRHRLQVSMKVNDITVRANSLHLYSEDEAAALRKGFPAEVAYEGIHRKKLPTTATLYQMFDDFEFSKQDIDRASKALFEKGFITCPLTMNNLLPENYTEIALERLAAVCTSVSGETIDDDVFKELSMLRANISFSPICAITPLKEDTSGLNKVERALYVSIVKTIVNALKYNSEKHILFKSSKPSVMLIADHNDEVRFPRGKSQHRCIFVSSHEDGIFHSYSPGEFMNELALYNIGTSEVIMTLLDRMIQYKLIFVDNYGIHVTTDGESYCRNFPIKGFMDPRMCAYWDKTLNKSKRNDVESQDATELYSLVSWVEQNIGKWVDQIHEYHKTSQHEKATQRQAASSRLKIKGADILAPTANAILPTEDTEKGFSLDAPEKGINGSTTKENAKPKETIKRETSSKVPSPTTPMSLRTKEPANEKQNVEKQPESINNITNKKPAPKTPNPTEQTASKTQKTDVATTRRNDQPQKDDDTADIPKHAIMCPFCKEKAITFSSRNFKCLNCGKLLHSQFTINDAIYTLNDKDLTMLAEKHRSGIKYGTNEVGDVLDAAYFITDGKKIKLTRRSPFVCPHCKSVISLYGWGFACSECDFYIPFSLYSYRLEKKDIAQLLRGMKTAPIEEMKDKRGNAIPPACISISSDGKIHFHKA